MSAVVNAIKSAIGKPRSVQFKEMQQAATAELRELEERREAGEARFIDVSIDGSASDKKMVREELQNIKERTEEIDAVLAALPARIREAEHQENMSFLEAKQADAKKLQRQILEI